MYVCIRRDAARRVSGKILNGAKYFSSGQFDDDERGRFQLSCLVMCFEIDDDWIMKTIGVQAKGAMKDYLKKVKAEKESQGEGSLWSK